MPETEKWPTIEAKFHGVVRTMTRLVVIHTPQWKEAPDSAEALGRYLTNPESAKSYHAGVDSDSVVQYVPDRFVAYAAPGTNNDGIQIAIVGFAEQTREQWRDKFSLAALSLFADVTAQYCLKYDIPVIRLSDQQCRDKNRGIIDHATASRVYRKSDHTDPGPNFPWTRFMGYVRAAHADRSGR